ncbi:hypothetical protein J4411_00695 [Candidatus Pacearchaeota archaeon]|nr:hypothetical protein [uncultured archaeon]AQS34675.1 hypothetical protein [uncultured archaeon]MBS3084414.1 hypothetical protein [Candidatus Pacearchaeota archaeon]
MAKIYVEEKNRERVENYLKSVDLNYSFEKDFTENEDLKGFDYVSSINLYVAKEKKLYGKNWYESHKELQKEGEKMLTTLEFIEYLKYVKVNNKDIYDEITKVKNPWRAEWLDADFKVKNGELYVNYNHIFDGNGKLVKCDSEVLDKNTLMKDKTPGISLEDYLEKNHTSQGFPNKEVKSGDLCYWFPRRDNNSVVRFLAFEDRAFLYCDRYPSRRGGYLGVRAARRE